MMPNLIVGRLLVTLLLLSFASCQTVNTTSGQFTGHPAPRANMVTEYLGIPYGLDTSNDQRFSEPIRASYDTDTRTADRNVSCPANALLGPGGVRQLPFASRVDFGVNGEFIYDVLTNTGFTYSEDCLTVNIWTKPQTGESSKAVMVFVPGGGFNFGSPSDPRYSGQYLADKNDVVIVTVSYRLNIFGFPNAPNTKQNLGLLDIRLAIEWVRDNIAAFGGDPNRITLFGQSAGGIAQDYYALAYRQDPIVNSFIAQSGTIYGFPPKPKSLTYGDWYNAAQRAGCGRTLGADGVLQCMRSKSSQEILTAISGPPGYGSLAAILPFWPVVDNELIFADSLDRLTSGQFARRPTLLGVTDDEGGVFEPGSTALNSFPAPSFLFDIAFKALFGCPASRRAASLVRNGVKTYRYRWFGYFPNTAIGLGKDSSSAYHTSELSTIFGTSADFGAANTAEQDAIQTYMMNAWTSFAKDPENGLSSLGWPVYSDNNPQLARLAYNNQSGISTTNANTYDGGCDLIGIVDIRGLLSRLQF